MVCWLLREACGNLVGGWDRWAAEFCPLLPGQQPPTPARPRPLPPHHPQELSSQRQVIESLRAQLVAATEQATKSAEAARGPNGSDGGNKEGGSDATGLLPKPQLKAGGGGQGGGK